MNAFEAAGLRRLVPSTVKVGPITYTVTEHDWPPDKEEGSQAMGRHIESRGQIMLLRSMPDDVKRVSLWHEIIHAIIDHAGQEHNEAWIEAVAHGVVEVLDDNGVL